jgi:hypothetical protein
MRKNSQRKSFGASAELFRTLLARPFAHCFTEASAIRSACSARFFPAQHVALFTLDAPVPKPRPAHALRWCRRSVILCTTRVAVTHSPLDRTKTSRLKSEGAEIFFAKFSTRQKYFVLVCRLFYFLKFSFDQALRSRKTGGALH